MRFIYLFLFILLFFNFFSLHFFNQLMGLASHIPIERCRLVKYDYWDKVMKQSFDLDEV